MSERVVYFNGQFVPESQARISIFDSAVVMGDMGFEITRTCRGEPFRLAEHVQRLMHTLDVLEIQPGISAADLIEITHETLARNKATESHDVDWTIIHNVSRGPDAGYAHLVPDDEQSPTLIVAAVPLTIKMAKVAPLYDRGVDLAIPAQRAIPSSLLDMHIKTRNRLHYQFASLQAARMGRGIWAVLEDPDGFLTEGTSGNIFLVTDGEVRTPSSRNLLIGVTRQFVIELCDRLQIPCTECDLMASDAQKADELFLTSTSIGILHGRSFNNHKIGNGTIGPITRKLREAMFQDIGLDLAEQARGYAAKLAAKD